MSDSAETLIRQKITTLDSVQRALGQRIQTQDYFVNILERTNVQLSQGMTFSSAFISALGVLFAIGSIIAGLLLFRQSKEYQKRIEEAINGYDAVVNKFIEEKKLELSMMIFNQESLKATNTEDNLKIDKDIRQLSEFRDSFNTFRTSTKRNQNS